MTDMRIEISGPAVPVRGNDIDTDRIIPARFLKTVVFEGLGEHAFEDDRKQVAEGGGQHPFDEARFAKARVLLVNANFGCGSSREHAPQAIKRWNDGIQAIVGESFAEIFFGNCVSLGMPCLTVDATTIEALMKTVEADPSADVTVNVEDRTVSVGDRKFEASIPDGPRKQFLEGRWDSTSELLESKAAVAQTASKLAYFSSYE